MPSIKGVFSPSKAAPELNVLSSLIDDHKQCSAQENAGIGREGLKVIVRKMDEMVENFDREEPMELVHWIPVLNFIDAQFDVLLGITNPATCGIPALHVSLKKDEKTKNGEEVEGDSSAMDVESAARIESVRAWETKMQAVEALDTEEINENLSIVRSLLRMSCLILTISFNKEAYASTEVSITWLNRLVLGNYDFPQIACSDGGLIFSLISLFPMTPSISPDVYSICSCSSRCTTTKLHR